MVVPIQQRKRVPVAPCDNQKDIISYLNLEILSVVLVEYSIFISGAFQSGQLEMILYLYQFKMK